MRSLLLLLILLSACSFTKRMPTVKPALYDMEEPLNLKEEPDDEEEREALPAGSFTGVHVSDARRSLEEMESEPEGLLVASVVENSPAAAAGLEEGDLLLEADGRPLHWASEWRQVELSTGPGRTLEVIYDRAGAERDARILVVARVHPAERTEAERFREEDRVGIVVRTATEVEARSAGLGPGGGAVVVGLSRSSPWRRTGLRFEDLVVEVDGKKITHPNVLLRAIRDAPRDEEVKVVYVRAGERFVIEAPVSRRATETTRVRIPLLYHYTRDRDRTTSWIFLGIFKHTRTPAAWETRVLWLFKFRGGDADRLVEVEE
ncbi:MAG: PDZ domain-containing protein [Planctomycetota bacterium]